MRIPKTLYHLAVEIALPFATAWVSHGEKRAQRYGRPLSELETANAEAIGILHPEHIRVLEIPSIFPWEQYTRGICYRYGILIRQDAAEDPSLVFHECVHTLQYERTSGISPFLRAYLFECLTEKYPNGKLEQEAITATAKHYG